MLCDAAQIHNTMSPALMILNKLSEGSQPTDEEPRLRNVSECVYNPAGKKGIKRVKRRENEFYTSELSAVLPEALSCSYSSRRTAAGMFLL